MTHDNVRDALEYAAGILEQNDAGGRLPDRLRQIADIHDSLLVALKFYANKDNWTPPMQKLEWDYTEPMPILDDAGHIARAAIAAVRGEEACER